MTVYVDTLFEMMPRTEQARRYGTRWCHLFTDACDDLEELHRMAAKIGLKRAYFQAHLTWPHYDLTPSKRALALQYGAQAVTLEEHKRLLAEAVTRRVARRATRESE